MGTGLGLLVGDGLGGDVGLAVGATYADAAQPKLRTQSAQLLALTAFEATKSLQQLERAAGHTLQEA